MFVVPEIPIGTPDVITVRSPLCNACRVEYAQIFQRAPDISHKEAGESPERGVEQACLMSVRQIKRYAGRNHLH